MKDIDASVIEARDLIAANRAGDRNAFEALVRRHQEVVCSTTFSVTGQGALGEELAQESFMIAWQSLAKLHDDRRFRAWLCGIACNVAGRARQRAARFRRSEELPTRGGSVADDRTSGDDTFGLETAAQQNDTVNLDSCSCRPDPRRSSRRGRKRS